MKQETERRVYGSLIVLGTFFSSFDLVGIFRSDGINIRGISLSFMILGVFIILAFMDYPLRYDTGVK